MNNFGRIFRLSIFGESHGQAVGITIDGCPPGIDVTKNDFSVDLNRRKSGAFGTTSRKESDEIEILSGIFNDKTTGSPITIMVCNRDTVSKDYEQFKDVARPGHADFTANTKYNDFNDLRGSGHFSGRITLGLVIAGVIAKKILPDVKFSAKLIEAGGQTDIDSAVKKAVAENDSIGGIIECRVNNLITGIGEPFFDSIESEISHLVFAVPGVRGIEFGDGFGAAKLKGSEHNDAIISADGKTATNHAGGINGGISNGNEIYFRVAVKPTSSILKTQRTYNLKTKKMTDLCINGRHDACIALRVPVIIEAAAAITLADLFLIKRAY